jgi:CPA1 family monovalent cation:H+ antiporter
MTTLAVVLGALVVAGFSRKMGWPTPLVVVVAGLIVSVIPGVPSVEIDPELVLTIILPPLLYSAALESSYVSIRRNLRPIALLSVGLVLFTTVVVGFAMHAVIGMPLAPAMVLGAIVAPPDAVASTAVGRTLGLPRRVLTILGGESLMNDGTALTAYQVAVAATVGAGMTWAKAGGLFLLEAVGGVVVGLLLGRAVLWLLCRIHDSVVENAISLVTPFVAFAIAQGLHTSGVLAVVLVGLTIGHAAPRVLSFSARLQSESVWKMVDFLLEASVFLVIGLQLQSALTHARGVAGPGQLFVWSTALLLVVIVSRFAWVYPATYVPRWIPAIRRKDPPPPWQVPTVIGWAGMRGVVSIAAAAALPLTVDGGDRFPFRDVIIFLTFVVVIGTLVLQGFTLPWLIRRLGVVGRESAADALAEAEAQYRAARAAGERLDALLLEEDDVPEEVVERLRARTAGRADTAWERLGGDADTPSTIYRRLRRQMVAAEREAFVELRDQGRVDDEVMRRVHRELDLEEAMLARE